MCNWCLITILRKLKIIGALQVYKLELISILAKFLFITLYPSTPPPPPPPPPPPHTKKYHAPELRKDLRVTYY